MRPTIDEQLDGASRLLRLAEEDPGISPAAAELVRNARRLIDRVSTSWSAALPFLQDDNATVSALLGSDASGTANGEGDLAAAAARNEELRAALTLRIQELPAGPDRAAIGAYLRARVAADPT